MAKRIAIKSYWQPWRDRPLRRTCELPWLQVLHYDWGMRLYLGRVMIDVPTPDWVTHRRRHGTIR